MLYYVVSKVKTQRKICFFNGHYLGLNEIKVLLKFHWMIIQCINKCLLQNDLHMGHIICNIVRHLQMYIYVYVYFLYDNLCTSPPQDLVTMHHKI